MEILYLDKVDSTQSYALKILDNKQIEPPFCIYTLNQTDGIGSRGNSWIGIKGNLFVTFVVPLDMLPIDLKIESASIYFAQIILEVLKEYKSQVWLKWPNDFYLEDKKIGGMITTISKNNVVCGFGLNINSSPIGFASLDIKIIPEKFVQDFIKKLKKFPLWKQVFRKYSVEFYKNKSFFTHSKQEKISLKDAILQEDGSILVNNERIYSLR